MMKSDPHALHGPSGEEGFLVADATLALAIAAMVLALAFQAQGLALKWSARARDLRLATSEARLHLANAPSNLIVGSSRSGADGRLDWQIARSAIGADERTHVALCVDVSMASLRGSNVGAVLRSETFCSSSGSTP